MMDVIWSKLDHCCLPFGLRAWQNKYRLTVIMGVASNRQEEAIASSWILQNKKRPG